MFHSLNSMDKTFVSITLNIFSLWFFENKEILKLKIRKYSNSYMVVHSYVQW